MARRFVLSQRSQPKPGIDFESDLNQQQLRAVTCGEGPKLVIAGAGSGKTRTLIYRVAYLLRQAITADQVLLVTFTNKAAREMLQRVRQLTRLQSHELWGGTFHSVGARVLRRHGDRFGYTESFSILDERDQRDLLRLCVTDIRVPVERRRFPSPKLLSAMISLQNNTGESLEAVLAERFPKAGDWSKEIEQIAARYTERKRGANAMDYDDLLVLWLRLLEEAPEIRRRYGRQFRHVLVDEYQDTNRIQGKIIDHLGASNGGNVMVVGDDCQSIYGFRGAHYDNILGFPQRHPSTEVFKLEINYRSTPEILSLTNASIRCNQNQYPKKLTPRRGRGMRPALVPCNYPDQEAAFVAERILQLRDEGTGLGRIAVLYRAHAHRLSLETTLLRYDVPYEVRGGLRFFEQAHIKDVLAHLRLLQNPRDEVAFRRVLLLQPGIGNVTADRVWQALGEPVADPEALLTALESDEVQKHLRRQSRAGWEEFMRTLREIYEAVDDPVAALRTVIDSGYEDYAASQFTNYESRREDLEQLAVFAGQYDSLQSLLEELVLLGELYGQEVRGRGEDDGESEAIVLSTIHQAKGLEWDVVFIIHLLEGALPSPRGLEEAAGEEEERRIFYVATTRARNELYLTYPIMRPTGRGGTLLQQPSRFLQELPAEFLELWELAVAGESAGLSGPGSEDSYDPNIDPVWDDDPAVDEPPATGAP